jgi:hypothetical protein
VSFAEVLSTKITQLKPKPKPEVAEGDSMEE